MHTNTSSAKVSAFVPRLLTLALAAAGARPVLAQISVEGVADRAIYADRVSFIVPVVAGWDYTASLNGAAVPAGVEIAIDQPQYYELEVHRRDTSAAAEERHLIRFIVRASARGNSERGLPPWVPYPAVPSATAEFAGARLELVVPARLPRALALPIAVRALGEDGRWAALNGDVAIGGADGVSLPLRRGFGSGLIDAGKLGIAAGGRRLEARAGGLATGRMVIFEDVAGWESPAAVVTGDVTWGPDARVQLDSDLNVSRGGVLSIEAGSVVKLGARVDIDVAGAVVIRGTMERPVVFAPADRTRPWGGFVLRGADARLEATGALLTGSGADPNWFDNVPDGGSSHRDEQPLVYLSDGARAELTDCFLVDNFGQAGHGEDSFLTLTRCLVQRCVTAGQYNGGSVRVTESALIEFPSSDAPFADDDNDALYLTGGEHFLEGSLVGWALDDGVDAGSGAGGAVSVTGCWFESCYHEAMAWSEERVATVRDTVAINNGQGIECGFGQPQVDVRRTLSTANVIGARFGDNYDWGYDGFLRVEDSLLLHNRRDVWGLNWDDWTWRVAQMDIRNNHLSQPAAPHPQNTTWRPASHGERLAPFLRAAATPVGVGIASRAETVDLDLGGGGGPAMDHAGQGGVAVRLSRFTTRPVSVAWHVLADGALLDSGTLRFDAGETVEPVPLDAALLRDHRTAQLSLERPVNAEISGRVQVELTLDGVTPGEPADVRFLRGDGNGDGRVDTADATAILLALFVGNDTDCRDALDANDSGDLDISDPLAVLRYLYLDGVPLPEPFAMPGVDPTEDGLDCDRRS